MDTELLATKLIIPPPVLQAVTRRRLCEALEHGVPSFRLTLVSAPAGYGKTTLLAQWARASNLPIAWLTVTESENEPERFFRGLLWAWEAVHPGIRDSQAGLLLGGLEPAMDAVIEAIVRVASAHDEPLAFVLDDSHLIQDTIIVRSLDFLLDNLPPTYRFVLAGREAPSLSLGRRRARNELLEIHTADLRFDNTEARDFLHGRMGLTLADSEFVGLNQQMEGWITGLQLVALTLHDRRGSGGRIEVSGRHRHVADYMGEEVLARLPDDARAFLLQTSILLQLCDSLCRAVTGNRQSQEMLETLERANLFLVPLDDSRAWFRYHRLFADFLRQRLAQLFPDEVDLLHSQAARWFLDHDLPEEAFRHALDGKDVEIVIEVLDRYLADKMFSGEIGVANTWVQSLPEHWVACNPELLLAQTTFYLLTGQPDAGVQRLALAEQMAVTGGDRMHPALAKAKAMRCYIACFSNDVADAEAWAELAFQALPVEDFADRAHVHHALGETYRNNGLWEDARTNYLKVLDLTNSYPSHPTARLLSVHVFGALADLELRLGRLRAAATYWSRALEAIQRPENWGHFPLPLTGWIHLRMGELSYELNHLEKAHDLVPQGLRHAELGGDARSVIAGKVILSRLELTEGDLDLAQTHLGEARTLLEQASIPEWIGPFDHCQIMLWIEQDKLRTAVDWCDITLADETVRNRPGGEITMLAIARALIHKGDPASLARAAGCLRELVAIADARGQLRVRIEALALRSMIHDQRGDRSGMLTDLGNALHEAEPEGYVRLFVDLGLPMARMLQEARSRGVMPEYIAKLLGAIGMDTGTGSTPDSMMVEPLSSRERDVLKLIAAGLTNREIAESLFISPETIKKHTGSIYGKLGVRGRIEAVTRARTLSIID